MVLYRASTAEARRYGLKQPKGNRQKAGKSALEEELVAQIKMAGLPEPLRNYPFAKKIGRKWAFDLAWPLDTVIRTEEGNNTNCYLHNALAVEVDGGTFLPGGGRHNRGAGYAKDCEKLCEAVLLGWRVLRVTGGMVRNGTALRLIERALA